MTIKIEREALLTVLSRAPQQPPLHHDTTGDDEFVHVSLPKKNEALVSFELDSTYTGFDDDDCCTVASASTSSSSSSSSIPRSVSFADTLVTEVRTRPRTPRSEVSKLFYSVEETQRWVDIFANRTHVETIWVSTCWSIPFSEWNSLTFVLCLSGSVKSTDLNESY